jgi:hypothetical protein
MAFFILISFVLAVAVLAPRFGADSRDLTRRGARRQFPLLRDEEPKPA